MNFQISPHGRFCCFDGATVYQFHPVFDWNAHNSCDQCALHGSYEPLEQTEECLYAPCDALHRADKTDGFWRKSELIDYQHFVKMLKNGG